MATRQASYGDLDDEPGTWSDGDSARLARGRGSRRQRAGRRDKQEQFANALGWFSVGLGLAQLTAPRGLARLIGIEPSDRSVATMRMLGVRELASGVGILTQQRPAGWMWSRVAGDVMDLALLGNALSSKSNERGRTTAATAAVLGVAALDVLSGVQLSRGGRRGRVSEDGAIGVTKSITVNRPVEEVYGFWRNFENLPRFMQHLESVVVTGDRQSHWKAKAPAGTAVEWDAETTEDRPNELIAWRSTQDSDVYNAGVVRFLPATGGRGTEVHIDLEYRPPAGKLGAVVAKLFGEEPSHQVAGDLRRFKQVLETGEVVYSDSTLYPKRPHAAQPPSERQAPRQDSDREIGLARSSEAAGRTTSNLDRESTTARGRDHEARA